MTTTVQTQFIVRPLTTEEDWWRLRNLILETHPITGPDFNWEVRHWDGNRFHREGAPWMPEHFAKHQLWETQDGQLAGVLIPDSGGAEPQIHPDYRSRIEEDMLAWAEENLAEATPDGKHRLNLNVFEYDAPRKQLLEKRGYQKTSDGWIVRRMHLGQQPLRTPVVTAGYTMRTTTADGADGEKLARLLNIAFGRPNFHQPEEVLNFMQRSPSFRDDLNLVMVAPDGEFAAHVGLTVDTVNNFAIFEPVCTHPDHRKRGLAQTLMFEGLHRLRALNVALVEVATGDGVDANALYNSIGFTEAYKAYCWRKEW